MCTGKVETAQALGSGKGTEGWFKLEKLSVTYDCSYHTSMAQAINVELFSETEGPSARVAVELAPTSAMELVRAILASLAKAGIDPGEVALGLAAPL